MPRLTRGDLFNEVEDSEIFTNPQLHHLGAYWCAAFDNPEAATGRSFVTLDKNIKKSIEWLHWAKKQGIKYPHVIDEVSK